MCCMRPVHQNYYSLSRVEMSVLPLHLFLRQANVSGKRKDDVLWCLFSWLLIVSKNFQFCLYKKSEFMTNKIDWNRWQCLKTLANIDVSVERLWESFPKDLIDMAATGLVARWLSHSSRVRGGHYFCAPCFLGAWLMILLCRNVKHLMLSCCCDPDVRAGCKHCSEPFFCWKLLKLLRFSQNCVFPVKMWLWDFMNNQSPWETTAKQEPWSLLWVSPIKPSQIKEVMAWANGY